MGLIVPPPEFSCLSSNVATHPDLADNLWVNPGEVAGDGIDNDGNGFVDDIHGWNFFDNKAGLFCSVSEDSHGTHVFGTIAAKGNNSTGVTGVMWDAQVMVLKFSGPFGSGPISNAIQAIQYATNKNAKVINASWVSSAFSQPLKDAIEACNCVFVAAAGNGGPDLIGDDNDTTPFYPAAFDSANIIAVAATDRNDNRSSFSNFGAASVDLGAPGSAILSTMPISTYGLLDGTSMATPHVSGVAGLVLAKFSNATVAEVRQHIVGSPDPVSAGRRPGFGCLRPRRSVISLPTGLGCESWSPHGLRHSGASIWLGTGPGGYSAFAQDAGGCNYLEPSL